MRGKYFSDMENGIQLVDKAECGDMSINEVYEKLFNMRGVELFLNCYKEVESAKDEKEKFKIIDRALAYGAVEDLKSANVTF